LGRINARNYLKARGLELGDPSLSGCVARKRCAVVEVSLDKKNAFT
jgi:hypothetical protein